MVQQHQVGAKGDAAVPSISQESRPKALLSKLMPLTCQRPSLSSNAASAPAWTSGSSADAVAGNRTPHAPKYQRSFDWGDADSGENV
eukprot:CAMPEP_0179242878 /NCGR_PEP_ID=MMETSP0797-20121207/17245_1 /TAXON_ID=47934 /ORGANISM="Dinophysis acuminata, Strain DAEP01" /LENGTH=86 /DNA_ID=CAMNT_0020950329 /DNA_START=63 /DNA_END=323 /DNA_ORIENTATION=-